MIFTPSIISDLLIIGIALVFVVHVVDQKEKRRWFVFDALNFFWVGVFVIYVLEVLHGYEGYTVIYSESVVQRTLFWILFGLVFVHVGYHLKVGGRWARKAPELPRRLKPDGLLWAAVALIGLGLIGWKIQIDGGGGLQRWASVSRGGSDWENVSGYGTQLAAVLAVGVGILVIHVEMHRRSVLLRFLAWGFLALILLFFLYLGSRSRVIILVVMAMMAWSLPRKKNFGWIILVPIFIALLVVTSFQAHYRDNFRNLSFNLHEIDWSEVPGVVLPSPFSGSEGNFDVSRGSEFSITAAVVQLVPEQIPYAYGREFLQFFTHPIPRAFWSDKRYPKNESWTPIHLAAGTSSHWVDYVKVPFVGGPAPGHVASWYYNGGAIGLIVGGLLVGIFLRFLRGLYDRSENSESYLLISFVTLPLGFGMVISHPFDWVYTAPLVVGPLVFLIYLSRSRGRDAKSTAVAPSGYRPKSRR